MGRRSSLCLVLAGILLTARPVQGASRSECDLSGPLGDFWPKIIRDWGRRIPGNNQGSTQIPIWVSLIYGDLPEGVASARLGAFLHRWSGLQERNWVRSEIWKRSYTHVEARPPASSLGFQQNLILLGTPTSNPFLSRVLAGAEIRLESDSLQIADRTYSGKDLLLVALLPSPFHSGKYVLCIAGMSEEVLLGLERLPFGDTDYVLFRGRKVVESGRFEKPRCDAWRAAKHPTVVPDHPGWATEEEGSLRYHFDSGRTSREAVRDLARRESEAVDAVTLRLRLPRNRERIEIFLYSSADEKFRETGDGSPAHLDEGALFVHRVLTPDSPPAAYQIALLLIVKNLGTRGAPGLRLALALAASPQFEGRTLEDFNSRVARTDNEPRLLAAVDGGSPSPGSGLVPALRAALFLRFLMDEGRTGELKQLYLNSATGSLSSHFRELLGETLDHAEERWAASLSQNVMARGGTAPSERAPVPDGGMEERRLLGQGRDLFRAREDAECRASLEALVKISPDNAEAHLLLARVAFRGGDPETALREARRAVELAPGDPEIVSWAHVTLGSAEAVRGHPTAAALELQDPELARGPNPPHRVAELWMENLGFSPNQKAVEEQRITQSRADLQNFDWDSAERELKSVLSSNPENAEAHFVLSQVYLQHQQYWLERATLSNELHPGTTPLDPALYGHLADRGEREMEKGMILTLPDLSRARIAQFSGEARNGSPIAGLDLFDPSLRKRSDWPDERHPHFFRGRNYFFASEWERARQELRLALGQDGTEARFLVWDLIYLGFIDLIQGKREAARAHFQSARDLGIGGRVGSAIRKGLALCETAKE